jgi:hypothetical protein
VNARVLSRLLAVGFGASAIGCGEDGPTLALPEAPDSSAVAVAACPEDARYAAPGDSAVGTAGVLRAVLVNASPRAPAKFTNVWTLDVQTADGAEVSDAEITRIETYMPVHGHTGQPDATAEPAGDPGAFRAELHFTMRGPWEVRLEVSSASGGSDFIVFQVCVGG